MNARFIAVLEIGSSKVKGAVARTDSDGGATLVAMHEVKTINCVRHGRVQNVQEVAARVEEVLRRLENDPAVAPRKIKRLRIAFGGRSLTSVHSEADAKLPAEVEITDEIIERLKRDAVFGLPADRHCVDVLPRSFNVDGAEVASNVVGMFGRNIHAAMTVILAAPDNRTALERVRLGAEGSQIERVYIPRQLAIARMALTPSEQQLGCALVDFGAETTTLSIHRDGVLHTLVTLPMGGRNITRDLAAGLSITEEQAEYIKTAQAAAIPDPQADTAGEAKEINSYSQARAGEIIANIVHRIEQAGFKTSELTAGIVLTGRASRMRRMPELFETQTKMKVRIAPADNSVRPGNTEADPVDSLDVMALAAWPLPQAQGSDLTEIPARDEEDPHATITVDTREIDEYSGYDPPPRRSRSTRTPRARHRRRQRARRRSRRRRQRRQRPQPHARQKTQAAPASRRNHRRHRRRRILRGRTRKPLRRHATLHLTHRTRIHRHHRPRGHRRIISHRQTRNHTWHPTIHNISTNTKATATSPTAS